MKFSFRSTAALLIAVLLLGVLFFFSRDASTPPDVKPRQAPEFSLKDYLGREVKLVDLRGRVLLINSWASWCPFCREELQDLVKVQKEFAEKLVIIAVDRAESPEVAKKYSDDLGLTDKLIFLLDPADSFYQSIGGFSMPETVFVNKDGMIVFHKRGPMELEEIRRRVQDTFGL